MIPEVEITDDTGVPEDLVSEVATGSEVDNFETDVLSEVSDTGWDTDLEIEGIHNILLNGILYLLQKRKKHMMLPVRSTMLQLVKLLVLFLLLILYVV